MNVLRRFARRVAVWALEAAAVVIVGGILLVEWETRRAFARRGRR